MLLDDRVLSVGIFSSVCSRCKNIRVSTVEGKVSCLAFDSIPREIWEGRNNHAAPFPGDKGFRFQETED